MNKTLAATTVLGALFLSTSALGQSADASACDTLQQQFDRIDPYHPGSNPNDEEARALRQEGGELCAAGKTEEGAAKIREALAKWGVTPHA